MPRKRSTSLLDNPVLLGTLIVLAFMVATYIAYDAQKGLPFVPTYDINANVVDAAKLVSGDEVRIGGARVGIVKTINAVPGNPPYAHLELALDKNQKLRADTRVEVRPRSVLGAKYVALTPGTSGPFLPSGGTLALSRDIPTVEIDDAFKTFDAQTRAGLQGVIGGMGDTVVGEGASFNETTGAISRLLPPLQRVAANLLSPATDVPGFINGLYASGTALAPVATSLGGVVDNGDVTLGALQAARGPLGQTIDALPATESTGTAALQQTSPVLADAATIARALRPGTRLLDQASARLVAALNAGTPALRDAQSVAQPLSALSQALDGAVPPHSSTLANSVTELDATVNALDPPLRVALPSQQVCNVGGILLRNLASSLSAGDSGGSWLATGLILGSGQNFQNATPDPSLHADYNPEEDARACQSGNEPYGPGVVINPPATGVGTTVDQTAPPASATALAQKAGLLTPTPGARLP
jgi:virulence factor Mce-like protein